MRGESSLSCPRVRVIVIRPRARWRIGRPTTGPALVGRRSAIMRLCRFSLDELILTGFYADDHVIPIDQASEAYCEDLGVELLLPTTEDLLDLLPPEGSSCHAVAELARWVDGLDADARAELSIPTESVQ